MKTLIRSMYPVCGAVLYFSLSLAAFGQNCSAPANPIVAENCLTGTPQNVWDPGINGDDPSIVGFADDISVDVGQTVNFKVNTNAKAFTMDIYRMGYYGGNGGPQGNQHHALSAASAEAARLHSRIQPRTWSIVATGQSQDHGRSRRRLHLGFISSI